MAGVDATTVYQIGDFLGDDAGFAAAGTGQDQQGAVDVANSLALFGVESGQGFVLTGGEFHGAKQGGKSSKIDDGLARGKCPGEDGRMVLALI